MINMGKGLGVKKEKDFSKWYTEVIQKGDLIDYTAVSGCTVLKPYSYFMWEIIQKATDEEFKKIGIQNAYFPLFIPEKFLSKEKEHVKGFSPEVAWVTHAGSTKLDERLAVRPTSETIMYPSYAKWIRSWRDLPLKINQWNNVVRWEFKNPVPLVRPREFLWNEGHTVYASQKEADKERNQILNIYQKVLKDCLALDGIVGKKTEKEKFAGALATYSIEMFMPNGKGAQGPDFHSDGQNFAKAFDIKFKNKDEKYEYAYQNTFAISIRVLGLMVGVHGDNHGLVLPPKIAPMQVVIVPILFDKTKAKVIKKSLDIKSKLKSYRVHVDNREEYSPGWKFNEYELKGVPIRIEIGPKDLEKNQVILVRRDTLEKQAVKIKDLDQKIKIILGEIHNDLYKKSKKFLEESIVKVKTMEELKKAVKDKKMALASFCNEPECEDWIKDKTGGATSRCIKEEIKGKCIYCKKDSQYLVYFAKAY